MSDFSTYPSPQLLIQLVTHQMEGDRDSAEGVSAENYEASPASHGTSHFNNNSHWKQGHSDGGSSSLYPTFQMKSLTLRVQDLTTPTTTPRITREPPNSDFLSLAFRFITPLPSAHFVPRSLSSPVSNPSLQLCGSPNTRRNAFSRSPPTPCTAAVWNCYPSSLLRSSAVLGGL